MNRQTVTQVQKYYHEPLIMSLQKLFEYSTYQMRAQKDIRYATYFDSQGEIVVVEDLLQIPHSVSQINVHDYYEFLMYERIQDTNRHHSQTKDKVIHFCNIIDPQACFQPKVSVGIT